MNKILIVFLFFSHLVFSQLNLNGYVVDESKNPIIGALVQFENSSKAVYTDYRGFFEIPKDTLSVLKVSALGYQNQFFKITNENEILVTLPTTVNNLAEIAIVIKKPSTNISLIGAIKTETLGREEFKKAACCNLSESFETNATVDVSFTDAVTGTKQLQMLGLSSVYALVSSENMPSFIGNNSVSGLDLVPGQWLESVQLIKGSGTVVNGFQSITGQINTEYKSPWDKTKTFLNYYYDNERRHEVNVIHNIQKDSVVAVGLFLQADRGTILMDMNSDGFADNLLGDKIVAMTTWENFQQKNSKWFNKGGVKYVFLDKQGGQMLYVENPYQIFKKNNRLEAWNKLAYFINPSKTKSIGLQTNLLTQNHNLLYGKNTLVAHEQRVFNNLIFQTTSKNANHTLSLGLSQIIQKIDNHFNQTNNLKYNWLEFNHGFFTEYTYTPNEKISVVAGIRYDYSSVSKNLITPRLHLKYSVFERGVIRASAGLGTKNINPFLENLGVFASNRNVIIAPNILDSREQAINLGINYTQKWEVLYRPMTLSVDFYRTNFRNKMIMDLDFSPQETHFYSAKNASYANSFMAQIEWEVIKFLNIKTAYRYYDVWNKYQSIGWAQNIFTPVHRYFLNMDYKITQKLIFDLTLNWMGKTRLPSSELNPEEYQWSNQSQNFYTLNTQIRFLPSKSWDFYLGINNLFNYQQKNPVISPNETDSPYFDATIVWAPVFGRMVYFGIKWEIFQ